MRGRDRTSRREPPRSGAQYPRRDRFSHPESSFIAYAAHELRGEITVQLALAEAVLTDPNADIAALRREGHGRGRGLRAPSNDCSRRC